MIQLSVIVPVYNVEKYILKCIESIFCQGIDDNTFELIIVNDGTKDNSMELISDIINRHANVIVINQENKGLSEARNSGLAKASGKYILFVDSDDFLIDNTLKPLLDVAISSSVDMVMGNFIKLSDDQIGCYIPDTINLSEIDKTIMLGEEAFVNYLNPRECYVWHTLYRRDFLLDNDIKFMSGIYIEDIPFSVECYLKTKKSILYPIPFYVYRQHSNSIVSTVNKKKLLDFSRVIAHVFSLQKSMYLSEKEHNKLSDITFSTFSIEMWYLIHEKGMYDFRKEIVKDLKDKVPDLFFGNGLKQYLISILFKWMPFTYLKIRYLIGK